MSKGTHAKMGWVGRTAACCVVLAALLASGAVLAAVAGPAEAVVAGGNGKVVFYRNGDVWTMNADGGGATKLTTNLNAESNPAVSPDGKKVAFQSNRAAPDGTTDYDVWRVRATDGANPKNLTNAPGNDTDPAWQPLP